MVALVSFEGGRLYLLFLRFLIKQANVRVDMTSQLLDLELKSNATELSSHHLVEAFLAAHYAQKERIEIEFNYQNIYLNYFDLFDQIYDEPDGQPEILIQL